MFKVGQKVVCIEPIKELKYGEIYTCNGYDDVFKDSIQIIELGIAGNGKYYCAYAYRFRPLDETFAEETLAQIKEQIEEEYLVLI